MDESAEEQLCTALRSFNVVDCRRLLSAPDIDINARVCERSKTFLHVVAASNCPDYENGCYACARLLLENGASIFVLDDYGMSPIETAIDNDKYEALNAMVDHVQSVDEMDLLKLFCRMYHECNQNHFMFLSTLLCRFYEPCLLALFAYARVCDARANDTGFSLENWEEIAALCAAASQCSKRRQHCVYRFLFLNRIGVRKGYIHPVNGQQMITGLTEHSSKYEWVEQRIEKKRRYLAREVLCRQEIHADILVTTCGLHALHLPALVLIFILHQMHPLYETVNLDLKWRMVCAIKHFFD